MNYVYLKRNSALTINMIWRVRHNGILEFFGVFTLEKSLQEESIVPDKLHKYPDCRISRSYLFRRKWKWIRSPTLGSRQHQHYSLCNEG